MNMRASAEDMGHDRCDDIREHAEGVAKSGDDAREGWQRMDHSGGHPSKWREDERDPLVDDKVSHCPSVSMRWSN